MVVDNDSRERLFLPPTLRTGLPITQVNLSRNLGAASRTEGAWASNPRSRWLVLLDDDSYPTDTEFVPRLLAQPDDVGAVSADVWLEPRTGSHPRRESGGLPEVFIGCGVAIRRELFLRLGGYDPSFHYYVEEYDLAARILLDSKRILFDPDWCVIHAKDAQNRNMDLILARLVRNNGWIAQRYAPDADRLREIREVRSRYRRIAAKERALAGYSQGLAELRRTLRLQHRRPMPDTLWDRFTGLSAARNALLRAYAQQPFSTAAVVDEGKNAWAVSRALTEMGVKVCAEGEDAQVRVIGTMSPGPMLDAYERRLAEAAHHGARVIAPWLVAQDCLTTAAREAA